MFDFTEYMGPDAYQRGLIPPPARKRYVDASKNEIPNFDISFDAVSHRAIIDIHSGQVLREEDNVFFDALMNMLEPRMRVHYGRLATDDLLFDLTIVVRDFMLELAEDGVLKRVDGRWRLCEV